MIYLIIYLIGCAATYIILAAYNDKCYHNEEMSSSWIFASWIFIIGVVVGLFVNLIKKINNLYPSLDWIKKLFKHEK